MKKLIALLLLPLLANAAPNDLLISQRNSTDTGTLSRTVTVPTGGANGVLGFNGVTILPMFYSVGPGLQLSSGVLSATAVAQINADWLASSGAAFIQNKPTLFSGTYADLTGKPPLFSGAYADLSGKPTLFSGAYVDLTGKPTIPAAQVQTDWNAVSGLGALLNKPSTFPPSAHNQAWSTITGAPTTIAGYGLIDAASLTQLAAKFNSPSGTAQQYIRGDGVLATFPVARRIETYIGTTDANGLITVTYSAAFTGVPSVQPAPPLAANQVWTIVSATPAGFSLRLTQRASVTLLGLEVLLAATTNVSGAPAQVLVVSQ